MCRIDYAIIVRACLKIDIPTYDIWIWTELIGCENSIFPLSRNVYKVTISQRMAVFFMFHNFSVAQWPFSNSIGKVITVLMKYFSYLLKMRKLHHFFKKFTQKIWYVESYWVIRLLKLIIIFATYLSDLIPMFSVCVERQHSTVKKCNYVLFGLIKYSYLKVGIYLSTLWQIF